MAIADEVDGRWSEQTVSRYGQEEELCDVGGKDKEEDVATCNVVGTRIGHGRQVRHLQHCRNGLVFFVQQQQLVNQK